MSYQLNNSYQSIEELIDKFSQDKLKLDLGCGYYKPCGFIGIDNLSGKSTQIANQDNLPDIYMDLNSEALPFKDNSCNEVSASHFLEHSDINHIVSEAYMVLAPGGTFTIIVPYANSAEGMYPGHVVFLTEKWFYENIPFQDKFEIVREIYDPSITYKQLPLIFRMLVPFRYARLFLFNACWQMTLVCRVRK